MSWDRLGLPQLGESVCNLIKASRKDDKRGEFKLFLDPEFLRPERLTLSAGSTAFALAAA